MKHKHLKTAILIPALLAGLFLCAAASAQAYSGSCGPNATWILDDSGKLTISGSGEMTSNPWINYRNSVKSVVIESGITNILNDAFKDSPSLDNISIPASVTGIGAYAFQKCTSLKAISIPGSVTSIGNYAFSKSALTSIIIPDSVTDLGQLMFYSCNGLKTATVQSRSNDIKFSSLFYDCFNLTTINIPSDHTTYTVNNGVVFDKAQKVLLFCPAGKTGTYSIPVGTQKINASAFYMCDNLTGITIPGSVKEIETRAFYFCSSLTNITLPEGITEIKPYTFVYCGLTSLTLPEHVTQVGEGAFLSCGALKKVHLPLSIETIGPEAFSDCALTQITLSNNVRKIGDNAFDSNVVIHAPKGSYAAQWAKNNGYNLTMAEPEYSVTLQYAKDQGTASASASRGKEGTKVTLKASPKKGFLFSGWSVVSGGVKIENNQFKIGSSDVVIKAKFKKDPSYACVKGAEYKLNTKKKTAVYLNPTSKTKTSITIPATITVDGVKYQVTEIASNAFKGCSKLKKVTIGKNITRIGKNAFKDCKKLATITIKTTKLTKKGIGSSSFKNIASKPTFKCPKKQKDDYKTWILKTGKAPKKSRFK